MLLDTGLQGDTSAGMRQAQATPEPSAPPEPKYITIEEARQLASDAAEQAFKRAQSLVDKSSNRMNEQISAQFEQVKDAYAMTGQQMTPEQEAMLRQNVVMQALTNRPAPADPQQVAAPAQPAQAQGAPTADVDPIAAAAIKMAESVGGFEQGDPEYQKVARSDLPPADWLAVVAEQVQAKKERLASTKARPAGSTLVGVSGGGTVNPNNISNINDPAELYALGEKQLRRKS